MLAGGSCIWVRAFLVTIMLLSHYNSLISDNLVVIEVTSFVPRSTEVLKCHMSLEAK